MSKLKKLLSVIIAAVMILTTLTVGVSAAPEYFDGENGEYDALDKPMLSLEQRSTMLLDMLDEFLAEQEEPIIIEISQIKLNLTSIDSALDSIVGIVDSGFLTEAFFGDLAKLNFDRIRDVRRAKATNTDADVLRNVLALFAQNAEVLGGVFDWDNFDVGSIGKVALSLVGQEYVDIVRDIPTFLKGMLYSYIMDDEQAKPPVGMTLDDMVQLLINNLLNEYMPEMGEVDISETPLYTIIRRAIEIGLNTFGKDALNNEAKYGLRNMCGVDYNREVEDDPGDESNLNALANVIDIHYEITDITLPTEEECENLFDELNNLIGFYVNKIVKGNIWVSGDNDKILPNLAALSKAILKVLPDVLGAQAQGFDFPSEEEIAKMTPMELFVKAAVISIDTFVDNVYIDPENCTTLRAFTTYLLRAYAADYLPSNNYVTQEEFDAHNSVCSNDTLWEEGFNAIIIDPDGDEGWQQILTDLAIYFAKGYTTLFKDVEYDQGFLDKDFETALVDAVNWGRENYLKGMLDTEKDILPGDDAFTMLDKLFLPIIPLDKLINIEGFRDLILDKLAGSIFDLDFDNLISVFDRKTGDDALLAKPAVTALLELATGFINGLFPGTIPALETFDDVITNKTLQTVAVNLIKSAGGTKREALMEGLIPIATLALKFESAQELGNLDIDAPSAIVPNASGVVSSQIILANETSGINTAAKDFEEVLDTDQIFKYVVENVESSVPGVSVKYNGNAITASNSVAIDGGAKVKFDITGTCNEEKPVTFTITYNVTDEDGENLTSEPQVAVCYSYISKTGTDAGIISNFDAALAQTGQISVIGGVNRYMYITDIADVRNIALQIEHKYEDGGSNNGAVTIKSASVTGLPAGFAVNPNVAQVIPAVDSNNHRFYGIVSPIIWTGEGEPQYGTYDIVISFVADGDTYSNVTYTVRTTVFYYDDAGLANLVASCIRENRQPSDYIGGSATPEWNEYMDALRVAAGVVNIPSTHNTFAAKQAQMAAAAERLNNAVAALQELFQAAGAQELLDLIDEYEGNRRDEEIPIAERKYFGREDYWLYTYVRYCNYSEEANHVATHSYAASSLDMVYARHELELYYSRLVPRWADTMQLQFEVEKAEAKEYDEETYTSASWERYEKALEFSQNLIDIFWAEDTYQGIGVDGNPDLSIIRPSQINAARHELINAQKALAPETGAVADYTRLDAAIQTATAIKDFTDYTQASVETFQTALTAAQGIERGLSYDCQTKIDNAAIALENATKGLKLKPADYVQLDAKLLEAKAKDLKLYTVDSAEKLTTAINNAEAINRSVLTCKDQKTVDALAEALDTAIKGLVEIGDEPTGTTYGIVEGSTGVFDEDNKYFYGFTRDDIEGGIYDGVFENYIWVENGSIDFDFSGNISGEDCYGTGTVINILDNDGEIVASYTIVVFGDVNGDACIDVFDVNYMIGLTNYDFEFEEGQEAYMAAADTDGDSDISVFDLGDVINASNYDGYISQTETNPSTGGRYFAEV